MRSPARRPAAAAGPSAASTASPARGGLSAGGEAPYHFDGSVDLLVRRGGAGRDAHHAGAGEPLGLDLAGALHVVRPRLDLAAQGGQAARVGAVAAAHDQHDIHLRGDLTGRLLPLLGRLADGVVDQGLAGQRGQGLQEAAQAARATASSARRRRRACRAARRRPEPTGSSTTTAPSPAQAVRPATSGWSRSPRISTT